MNLTVDIGNTRMKWALFEGDRLVRADVAERDAEGGCDLRGLWQQMGVVVERAMVCATGRLELERLQLGAEQVSVLSCRTPMPIALDYATPETLGPDRMAAACGARRLFKGRGCVIVDAGTCITVDYLDRDGVFRGGAILPGVEMKFRALHTFTAKLPLYTDVDFLQQPVTGRSTQESMEAGVLTATRFAVEGFVNHYRRADADTAVLLTGGDANWVWGEGRLGVKDCVWEPYLVMIGLNEIMINNQAFQPLDREQYDSNII